MNELREILRYMALGISFIVIFSCINILLSQFVRNGETNLIVVMRMLFDLKMVPEIASVAYGLTVLSMFGGFSYCIGRGIAELSNRLLHRVPRKWKRLRWVFGLFDYL
jgi:hypothetical protein